MKISIKADLQIDKVKALGANAFKKGIKRVPALDKDLMNMLKDVQVGDKKTMPIMNAWVQGWDEENLNKKGAIPSRKEIEELIEREKALEEEHKKDKEMSWRERYYRDYSKKESNQKIKASIISAVEEIKRDLDELQTNTISFKDILNWIDRTGNFSHHVSRGDGEQIADLLIHNYRVQVK